MFLSSIALHSWRRTLLFPAAARRYRAFLTSAISAASSSEGEMAAASAAAAALRAKAVAIAPPQCWSQPPDSPPAVLSPPSSSSSSSSPLPPLSGLAFASKEMFDVAGQERAFGSPSFREWRKKNENDGDVAVETAPAVAALVAAGATLVGRTTMSELAYDLAGDHEFYEAPPNPAFFVVFDAKGKEDKGEATSTSTSTTTATRTSFPSSSPYRLCGGSSSGSACAVASRAVDFALGSDTGGSVRVPASYCGVFGFRPTHGRVSLVNAQALAPSFDTGAWFARDARTLRSVGLVLLKTGGKKRAKSGEGGGSLKLRRWLVAADAFDRAQPGVARAIFDAVSESKNDIENLLSSPPTEVRIWDEGSGLGSSQTKDAFRFAQAREIVGEKGLGAFLRSNPKLGDVAGARIKFAQSVTEEQEAQALDVRRRYTAMLEGLIGDDGVVFLPAAPDTAPLRGAQATDAVRNAILELTCPAGLAGLPQLVVPVGKIEAEGSGGPVGLGILGPRDSDEELLELAVALAEVLVEKA